MKGAERWEDPEIVAEFAAREPDHRLRSLLDCLGRQRPIRALDLGCAAGRNTIFLAAEGHDVIAVDLSSAMVEETRRRLASLIGTQAAESRVIRGSMLDLSFLGDSSFDLIIALGVFHQASTVEEWEHATAESVRVLRPGGYVLLAQFSPGTDLTGADGQPDPDEKHLYRIRNGSVAVLFDAAELDRRMRMHGLIPLEPTSTVERPHEPAGRRVTVNALYQKEGGAS